MTSISASPHPSFVLSQPRLLLHAEGALLFIAALLLYARLGANAWVLLLLFFSFDVFMLGYLLNPRLGSWVYNLGHTLLVPLALSLLGFFANSEPVLAFALIWVAHIGFDRLMGYGLKYPTAFQDTHFQRV
jgi:hypothetical protein